MPENKRIFFVNGPWQAMVALSSFLYEKRSFHLDDGVQNTVVILGDRYIPESLVTLHRIFEAVMGDVEFVPIRRERERLYRLRMLLNPGLMMKRLREGGVLDGVAEIWTIDFFDRSILGLYHDTPIHMFEDGVISYVNYNNPGACAARETSPLNVVKHYFMSPVLLDNPHSKVVQLSAEVVLKTIDVVRTSGLFSFGAETLRTDRKIALLLGQGYHRSLKVARDDELKVYVKAAEKLVAEGYAILWKDHPRDPQPFAAELREHFDDAMLPLDDSMQTWPIEIILRSLPVEICVAATCSALIYSQLLFGVEGRSIAKEMGAAHFLGRRGEWRKSIFDKECRIIEKIADDFE